MTIDADAPPASWATTTLGEIAEVNPSGTTVAADDDQPVTFLPMAAVEELSGRIDLSRQRAFGEVKKGFTRFRDGDLLFAKITPCMENGKTAVVRGLLGGIGCGTTEFHVLRAASGVHPDYLRYFVVRSAFRQQARRNMQGAVGQQRVPAKFLREAPLPLAPTEEQQRIVSKIDELFSRIEEGERALERVQRLVERYRQSVLKAAVTGELTRVWREKFKGQHESGEALLARILKARREAWEKAEFEKQKAKGIAPTNDKWKQKYVEPAQPEIVELPDLPEGWTWASMAQLAWASSYGTSEKCGYGTDGLAVLRIPNIRSGRFDFNDLKNATSDLGVEVGDLVSSGDLLVVRTNGSERIIGLGAVSLAGPPTPCYFASYLIRFRLAMAQELAAWVNFCWQSHIVRGFVSKRKATSAGQYNVSQSSLMELCLPIPPTAERDVIVDEMERVASKVEYAAASTFGLTDLAAELRQAVLKLAFSGALVPQDGTEEPATLLLDRILVERSAAIAKPRRGFKNESQQSV